ncbi:protoporphyrinogen oxidase [bacterium]|nr:protoporphyrinogen oxidase [bacterium]
MSEQTFDCIVLGAGVSGLATAWRLMKNGQRVLVVEKQPRCGGVITTKQEDDYLIEIGPNSFTSFPLAIVELLDELGIRDRAFAQPLSEHDRFVWYKGKLRKVPMGPGGLITTDILSLGQKFKAVSGIFAKKGRVEQDMELGEFFRQRVGPAVVERMLKPFMAGVYAADADRISFAATLPKLYEPMRQHESIMAALKSLRKPGQKRKKRPKRALVSFPNGLKELPEALVSGLEKAGATLEFETTATLRPGTNCRWAVEYNGKTAESDQVVIATPTSQAADYLENIAAPAAMELRAIPYAGLIVFHVGAPEEMFAENRNGFGFLSVAEQGVRVLGMIWSDRIFPNRAPDGHRLLTCFYGGDKDSEVLGWDEDRLRKQLVEDLKTTMKFRGGDLPFLKFHRWERALPIFRVGHMDRMAKAREALPQGIELLGNYLGGVSIPDRVDKANTLAREILERAGKRDKEFA